MRGSVCCIVAVLVLAGCVDGGAPDPGAPPGPVADPAPALDGDGDVGDEETTPPDEEEGSDGEDDAPAGSDGEPADGGEGPGNSTADQDAGPIADPTRVVVAQFDTGTNPFHPCFRHPDADPGAIADLPDHDTLQLSFEDDYAASLEASQDELASIQPGTLYHIAGTRILFYGEAGELVDEYPHGSQASSQIVCEDFGLAPEAWLVVLNWYEDRSNNVDYLAWVTAQDWIDIVHLNIQDTPVPGPSARTLAIHDLIASGKFVVIAAGNGVTGIAPSYPMELSSYNGPPGSLIVGASARPGATGHDGYSYYSNLNPHVVMDACGTAAAAPDTFGTTTFSGTSSASPRTTGYVALLLQDLRDHFGPDVLHADSLLEIPSDAAPEEGPLSDGVLTVPELHEVVRKTATPNPHPSEYDGEDCLSIPQPVDLPFANYPKMGYGEVSEVTRPDAIAVLLGEAPMPDRSTEDRFYEASESVRETYWG